MTSRAQSSGRHACAVIVLVLAASVAWCQTTPQALVAPQVQVAPVTVGKKTLFSVPGVLSFTADARAAAISKRIKELSKDVMFKPESLSVADAEGAADIMAGDLVVMSVTDQDAKLAGQSRHELAADYAQRIGSALSGLRKEYSVQSLVLGGAYTLIATAVLMLILRLMSYVFPKLYAKLHSWRGTKIPSLRIQKFELLPADRIADFAIAVAKLVRLVIGLVALYFYASCHPTILRSGMEISSRFPRTIYRRGMSHRRSICGWKI